MSNSNLTEAQRAKNDEFYTQYAEIEKEILAYLEFNPDVFRGKTLLLPELSAVPGSGGDFILKKGVDKHEGIRNDFSTNH